MKNKNLKNLNIMKTQITKLMAAAMLLTAPMAANATNNNTERNLKVSAQNQKAVVLQMGNLQEGTMITLVDGEDVKLYSDNVEQGSYSRTFDLSSVEDGQVYLHIESKDKLEILPIEVSASGAKIKRSAEQIILKPIVKMNDDQAKVFFGDMDSATRVTLYDQNGDIAYRDSIEEGTASKKYDLSKLADGNYQMVFSANGRSFYHTIILK